jgi:hypothetical protein
MYATCLHCHAPLGANEMLEHFPVGKRLAFDAEKGRLWVVCPHCAQWNLSPLDERWEAIEEGERLFRDTPLRVTTDQVGLAKLRDGSEIIRIGRPMLPEFAAWRYGERFTTRWRRVGLPVGVLAIGLSFGGLLGPMVGLGVSGLPSMAWIFGSNYVLKRRVLARLHDAQGPIALTAAHLTRSRFTLDGDDLSTLVLSVPHIRRNTAVGRFTDPTDALDRLVTFQGAAALDAMRVILPSINRHGGRQRAVDDAVRVLGETGSYEASLAKVARMRTPEGGLPSLPIEVRLALEMASQAESERRAMEGELGALAAAWKDAEEIAAIADDLTLPQQVLDRLGRLGGG